MESESPLCKSSSNFGFEKARLGRIVLREQITLDQKGTYARLVPIESILIGCIHIESRGLRWWLDWKTDEGILCCPVRQMINGI